MLDFNDASGTRLESEVQNELTDMWQPRGLSVSWWAFGDSNIQYVTTAAGSSNSGFTVDRQSSGRVRFFANNASAFPYVAEETVASADNVLFHFVWTWTGVDASGETELYRDGVVRTTSTLLSGNGDPVLGNNNQIQIGAPGIGDGEHSVAGIGMWSRILSQAEITSLSLKLSPAWFPNELRAYWKIDEIEVEQPIVGKHAMRMIESPPRSFRLGTDLIEPPNYRWGSHQHNPVDLAPAADTVWRIRRR